jgi:hypothetical protein
MSAFSLPFLCRRCPAFRAPLHAGAEVVAAENTKSFTSPTFSPQVPHAPYDRADRRDRDDHGKVDCEGPPDGRSPNGGSFEGLALPTREPGAGIFAKREIIWVAMQPPPRGRSLVDVDFRVAGEPIHPYNEPTTGRLDRLRARVAGALVHSDPSKLVQDVVAARPEHGRNDAQEQRHKRAYREGMTAESAHRGGHLNAPANELRMSADPPQAQRLPLPLALKWRRNALCLSGAHLIAQKQAFTLSHTICERIAYRAIWALARGRVA